LVAWVTGDITLGDLPGETVNFGSLHVWGTQNVTITEDSDTVLQSGPWWPSSFYDDSLVMGDLTLTSAGSITDADNNSIEVQGHAIYTAADEIVLGDTATDNFMADTLEFHSANSYVWIEENGDMYVSAASDADESVALRAFATGTSSLTVDAPINAGTHIDLTADGDLEIYDDLLAGTDVYLRADDNGWGEGNLTVGNSATVYAANGVIWALGQNIDLGSGTLLLAGGRNLIGSFDGVDLVYFGDEIDFSIPCWPQRISPTTAPSRAPSAPSSSAPISTSMPSCLETIPATAPSSD